MTINLAYLKDKVPYFLIGLFTFSLFFPLRHVFFAPSSYLTGAYSDFTSISLYLSDILLILLAVTIYSRSDRQKTLSWPIFALFITVFFGYFVHKSDFFPLFTFFTIKLLELIVLHETYRKLHYPLIKAFFYVFIVFSFLSVVIATLQFYLQTSVGGVIHFLGEPVLGPDILGVAKLNLDGHTFIRPYAAFPHPNLLSAYLLVSIFASIYLTVTENRRWKALLLCFALSTSVFGLFITFSRAAYISAAIGLVVYFTISILRLGFLKRMAVILVIVILAALVSFLILRPYLVTRATIKDSSTKERLFYDKVGLEIIEDRPWLGTGWGTSVLHMQQYSSVALQPWEIQPIHNYYLILAAEAGIPMALVFIFIFFWYLISIFRMTWKKSGEVAGLTYVAMLSSTILSFFVLMLFDHYFYTIQQTQFLLWLVLGLVAREAYLNKDVLE